MSAAEKWPGLGREKKRGRKIHILNFRLLQFLELKFSRDFGAWEMVVFFCSTGDLINGWHLRRVESCSLHRLVKAFGDGLCYMFVDLVHG